LLTRATTVLAALFIVGALALSIFGARGPGSVVGGIDGPAPTPAPTNATPAPAANTPMPPGNSTP
jgi:preprotein translocase subunit SecG